MEILRITLVCLLTKNILSENAQAPAKIQEKLKKTLIVSYNKAKMTELEIKEEKGRLEQTCRCNVKNLAAVGAFILTYSEVTHPGIESLNLDPSKEVGVEDQLLTPYAQKIATDPDVHKQWALKDLPNNADINAADGWRQYLSDSKGGDPNGPSVVVAVIDTGVDYNHEDLKDIMWTNPGEIAGNGIDDDHNGYVDDVYGADFVNDDVDPMDDDPFGHGTHCAGIIAAKENNGKGIAGVASFTKGKVKIMAVKVLPGTSADQLSGLNYAIENGAKISSNSYGDDDMNANKEKMWSNVLQNNPNHLFVAAAGNTHTHLENKIGNSYRDFPCGIKLPNILCVASSTENGTKSYWSSYGKDFVHVFAPGKGIYSTIPNNRYGMKSGTSMACPHVSGLAALIWTMQPGKTAPQVREVIEANAQKKDAFKNMVSSGGLIDMGKTIRALKDCSTKNTIWINAAWIWYSQEKSWEACGTTGSDNKKCDLWQFKLRGGWCYLYKERSYSRTKSYNNRITGRKGCPAGSK